MPIHREEKADFSISDGFAELMLPNNLELVVFKDEIWEETNGQLGRVNVGLSIHNLASRINSMSDGELQRLINAVSQDKGIHSDRLELTFKHGHVSPTEFAIEILAHHFNVGAEVLTGLGEQDVLTRMETLPGNQGEGFRKRMLRENRLQKFTSGDIPAGAVLHLMSDGTLFQIVS